MQQAAAISRISDEHRRRYREDGYFILENAISPSDLELIRRECDAEVRRTEAAGPENNITFSGRYFIPVPSQRSGRLDPFIYGDLLADICRTTIGGDAYLFNDQFVVKGPDAAGADTSFAWHQDSGYVGFPHQPYLSCWCALDDCSVENGTVRMLPYQRAGAGALVKHEWSAAAKSFVAYTGSDPGEPAIVKAGTIVVFSSLTLHSSGANRTDRYRRAYLVQYSPEAITGDDGNLRILAVPFLRGGERVRAGG